jgi:hypothetical protein
MGDIFALIFFYVGFSDVGRPIVEQRLVHVDFIKGSLNSHTQCGVIKDALQVCRLTHCDVKYMSMDG